MFIPYAEIYKNAKSMDYIVDKRLQMVHYAFEFGYKPACRFFKVDRHVLKKWCHRYLLNGIDGLKNKSTRPFTSPRKLPDKITKKIEEVTIDSKVKKKYITVKNIRKKTNIKHYSDTSINRYINKALKKSKRNLLKDNSNSRSTAFKEKLKPFEIIQIDIKYLTDIDNLKPFFNDNSSISLMKYQITARDVSTGFPVIAFAPDKSVSYTKLFLEKVLLPFLKQFKYLDFKSIKIQTDNGMEFTNRYIRTYSGKAAKDSAFTVFINNNFKEHKTIIPGHCTAQSEVESFHWSIERDCLAWDDIVDNNSLIKYVNQYINTYVHTVITNRGYSPYQKIKETLLVRKVKVPKATLLSIKEQ